jgi:hypothetical protein
MQNQLYFVMTTEGPSIFANYKLFGFQKTPFDMSLMLNLLLHEMIHESKRLKN